MTLGPLPLACLGASGLVVGSFCTNYALRFSRGEQALRGASRCDACGMQLGYAATLPVISYVALRGACVRCGARIDPLHLVGEVAGGFVAIGALAGGSFERAMLAAVIGFALLTASLIDIKLKRLPDELTLVAAVAALALAFMRGPSTLLGSLLAALITFLVLEGVRRGFLRVSGEPGLGFGDVKLMTALALWLETGTPIAIAVASLAGLIAFALIRPSDRRMAFGPTIAASCWLLGIGREAGWWSI